MVMLRDVFAVQMCRSRSRSRAGRAEFYLDDPQATALPRSRRRSRKSKKGKKKKHERSRVRQPYMNTCLSIPYLSSKFRS